MSSLKQWLLIGLVAIAFLATGFGGLRDLVGHQFQVTREHGWNDGMFLMLTAILVALVVK